MYWTMSSSMFLEHKSSSYCTGDHEQSLVTTDVTKLKPHIPRSVPIHLSEIPSKKDMIKLRCPEAVSLDIEYPILWAEGTMLWSKIGNYPFWPSMVSKDPFSKKFTTLKGTKRKFRSYHVQFFGIGAERGWVSGSCTILFEGLLKFMEIQRTHGHMTICHGFQKSSNSFKVSSTWLQEWNLAVAEAEKAHGLSIENRKEQYAFRYVFLKGKTSELVRSDTQIWNYAASKRISEDTESGNIVTDEETDDTCDIFGEHRRVWYDSDDCYSSDDDSSSSKDRQSRKFPIKLLSPKGSFSIFVEKHQPFTLRDHPDWDVDEAVDYLRQNWSFMSETQKNKYTSRLHPNCSSGPESENLQQTKEKIEDILEEVDPLELDLEILKLLASPVESERDEDGQVCDICLEDSDNVIPCQGICGNVFHVSCVDLNDIESEIFICSSCQSEVPPCFYCKMTEGHMLKCTRCPKFYHLACLNKLKHAYPVDSGFVCPLHTCVSCVNRSVCVTKASEGNLWTCVRCSLTCHSDLMCQPAGILRLGGSKMLCCNHFVPNKKKAVHSRVNLKRCSTCGKDGDLLRCSSCPSAFHKECTTARMEPGVLWRCADCWSQRLPLYGDLVWIKLGFYRWWPGEICHPSHVPANIQKKPHVVGEFPVRFFGSWDFFWLHRGRVIPFLKGEMCKRDTSTSTLDVTFTQGVAEARAAFQLWQAVTETRECRKENNSKSMGWDELDK